MIANGNFPTYEQQQQAITLLQELGVDIDTLLAGRVVKSVQRGIATLDAGVTSINVTISPITLNKSYLDFTFSNTDTVYTAASNHLLRGQFTNSTSITFSKAAVGGGVSTIAWQVIEFY